MNNPGAFLRQMPDAERVLRVCGCQGLDKASDYEFFSAFCKTSDKLCHHRLLLAAKALLSQNGCREKITPNSAERIWRYFADRFFLDVPAESAYATDGDYDLPAAKLSLEEFFSLEELLERAIDADGLLAFEKNLLAAFSVSEKRGVLVDLPDEVYQKQPNPHATMIALQTKDRTALSLQALRIFSQAHVPLLIVLRESGKAASAFLARLDLLVGLPQLFLLLSPSTWEKGIDLLLALGKSENAPVLQEKDLALVAPLFSYRYPIGKSCLLLQELCRKSCKND